MLATFAHRGEAFPRHLKRVSSIRRPPLIGWRYDVFQQPHVRKHEIRRRSRSGLGTPYELIFDLLTKQDKRKQKDAESLRKEFQKHSKIWRDETAFTSSVSDIVLHASYQRIIGLGGEVVPLILRELDKSPRFWFWALEAITGENPVPKSENGQVRQMTKRWIDWGRAKGMI